MLNENLHSKAKHHYILILLYILYNFTSNACTTKAVEWSSCIDLWQMVYVLFNADEVIKTQKDINYTAKRWESYNVERTDVIWPEYNFTQKFINPSNCLAILNILICFESRCISVPLPLESRTQIVQQNFNGIQY